MIRLKNDICVKPEHIICMSRHTIFGKYMGGDIIPLGSDYIGSPSCQYYYGLYVDVCHKSTNSGRHFLYFKTKEECDEKLKEINKYVDNMCIKLKDGVICGSSQYHSF